MKFIKLTALKQDGRTYAAWFLVIGRWVFRLTRDK